MKTLALLRHAKSSWNDPQLDDFDRPLNGRGRDAAERIGKEMRRQRLEFDLVLASPAKRVVETLEHVEKGYGRPLQPQFDRAIYGAASDGLLQRIAGVRDPVGSLLLVGHNPALHELAVALVDPADPTRGAVADRFPTATLCIIQLAAEAWSAARPGTGRLLAFVTPASLES